jgi:signal transduction histidine kinase
MGELIDLLPDAVFQLDPDRRIITANRQAAGLTRYPLAELIGKDCTELAPRDPDGRPLWNGGWPLTARLRSVRAFPEQQVTLRRKDGTDVRTHISGSFQRDEGGMIAGAVITVREGADRTLTSASGIEIVSTVSHELRSPLTSVKGYTSLLLNRWDRLKDDQKRMMLEQVNHDADRVTRLITELLDISRLETGRLVLRRQLVDLAALALTVVDKVGLEYQELQAELSFPEGFPRVYADPDKVEQVLTNLVENACKYGSPTGMTVSGRMTEQEVSVSVGDRGEGIPAEDLPKVFTKFFRRSEGKPTGSGLGLWISRGLVEAHGGRLEARSILGQGTTFRFTLPLIDLEEELSGP